MEGSVMVTTATANNSQPLASQPGVTCTIFRAFALSLALMSDPRFARLKSDPRFRRPRKQKSKVVVDERFESVFAPEKKPGNKGKSGM